MGLWPCELAAGSWPGGLAKLGVLANLADSPPSQSLTFFPLPPPSSSFRLPFPSVLVSLFLKMYFIDLLRRGREREREQEISMREKHRPAASCTPPIGDVPATKVHALDRNRTWDPSIPRAMLYPLSQTRFSYGTFFQWECSRLIQPH